MKILGISGSLRAESSNTALLRAAAACAPANIAFILYHGLGGLPHYSPELDGENSPETVHEFRALLRGADGIVICTPEYAHGMPGSLKNAFDWIVSSGEFDGGKPAAALSASPSFLGGDKAHASLVQTLTVLGAKIPEGATLIVPSIRAKLDDQGNVSDAATLQALKMVLEILIQAIKDRSLRPN